jgi:hypothetical protein
MFASIGSVAITMLAGRGSVVDPESGSNLDSAPAASAPGSRQVAASNTYRLGIHVQIDVDRLPRTGEFQ